MLIPFIVIAAILYLMWFGFMLVMICVFAIGRIIWYPIKWAWQVLVWLLREVWKATAWLLDRAFTGKGHQRI